MKTTISKLSIFLVIVALGIFVVVASASAGQPIPIAIRGQYASTTSSTCMIAPLGFDDKLQPNNGLAIISMQYREGVFTFENDGTGSVRQNGSVITLPYTSNGQVIPPSAGSQTMSMDFTYTATDDGMITITQVPGTSIATFTSGPNKDKIFHTEGGSLKGTISPDGKNIILNVSASNLLKLSGGGLPLFNGNPPYDQNHSCSSSLVLIWQHNEVP